MSRVIQLLSNFNHIYALTDTGEIYVRRHRKNKCRMEAYWVQISSPAVDPTDPSRIDPDPPRFSDPAEYSPTPCQSPPSEPEDSSDFNSLSSPGQGIHRSRFQKPQPRRPTSIGSDGNYIPQLGD